MLDVVSAVRFRSKDIVKRCVMTEKIERIRKTTADIFIDSAAIAGIAFFSVLVTGQPNVLYPALIAFGLSFCTQLAAERHIKKA